MIGKDRNFGAVCMGCLKNTGRNIGMNSSYYNNEKPFN